MPQFLKRLLIPLLVAASLWQAAAAQSTSSAGLQAFSALSGPPDNINIGTLNMHVELPLVHIRSRGYDFNYSFQFDTGNNWVMRLAAPAATLTFTVPTWEYCYAPNPEDPNPNYSVYTSAVPTVIDLHGTPHDIKGLFTDFSQCPELNGGSRYFFNSDGTTTDGSGYLVALDTNNGTFALTDISGIRIPNAIPNDGDDYSYVLNGSQGSIPWYYGDGTHTYSGVISTDIHGNRVTFTAVNGSAGTAPNALTTVTLPTGAVVTQSGIVPTSNPAVYEQIIGYTDSGGNPVQTKIHYYHPDSDFPLRNTLKDIVYPDGTSYQITYETSPGPYAPILIHSITTPTGAVITYSYGSTYLDSSNYYRRANWTVSQSLTRTVSGTAPSGSTTYSVGPQTILYVGAPPANSYTSWNAQTSDGVTETDYSFVRTLQTPPYETKRQIYDLSSTPKKLLLTKATCYNGQTSGCETGWPFKSGGSYYDDPVNQTTETLSYPDGPSKTTTTKFNTNGLVTEVDNYDYGLTSGTPLRSVVTTYATLGNNIRNRPSTITTYSNGNVVAKTSYSYDAPTLVTSSGLTIAPLPDANNPSLISGSARGNPTQIDRQVNAAGCSISTVTAYYDTGLPSSTTTSQNTSCGTDLPEKTVFTYDGTGAFLSSTDQVKSDGSNVNGVSHKIYTTFDANQGMLLSATDANGVVTKYDYDAMNRAAHVRNAYGVLESTTRYDYSVPNTVKTFQDKEAANDGLFQSTVVYDGLGDILTATAVDGSVTSTTYNFNGLPVSSSNPYLTTTASATDGTTTYSYDALGRKVLECLPDNGTGTTCSPGASYRRWVYRGASSVVYKDESGNATQQSYDALGRLVAVREPNGLNTSYSYDGLDNLINVVQSGTGNESPRTRHFDYDQVSRLQQSYNPETGWICYGTLISGTSPIGNNCKADYDGNGNLWHKTDARGVVTAYSYDALNRLLSKAYSVVYAASATPSSCYEYDYAFTGSTGTYFKGRLTSSWTQWNSCSASAPSSGAITRQSILEYDALGRPRQIQQCHLSNCVTGNPAVPYLVTAEYDLAGNQTSVKDNVKVDPYTYGIKFTSAFDPQGRFHQLTSSYTNNNTYPTNLRNVQTFAPGGLPTGVTIGNSMNMTRTYDNRLRPQSAIVEKP